MADLKKQHHKSKEEILFDEKNKKEIARKRVIIVDKFYPALIKATISVDEAKSLINAMSTLLMENVLQTMKERKIDEISESMIKILCTDGQRLPEIKELISTLSGENLFVSREIIEGMTKAINAMEMDEMRERNLSTLKTNWDKYLN